MLVVINGESLKEEKTIEMKEEYIGDNVRVITGDERFYIIRSETTNTTSESNIWLLVDEYTPNADWSAINHVTRVKLNMTKGIEDLVGSSLGSGANEPYSPSMQVRIALDFAVWRLINLNIIDGLSRDSSGQVCVHYSNALVSQLLL